jgi:hypothetical protein
MSKFFVSLNRQSYNPKVIKKALIPKIFSEKWKKPLEYDFQSG